jgi:cytochrome c-type biogenesis protein CcsB
MALYSLLLVIIYLILEKYLGQKIFGIFVTPIVIVTLLVASVLPKDIQPLVPALQNNLIRFHVTIAILSYAAFTIAFSASLAYLMQERALKSKHQKTLIFRLPSLKKMEDISYFMVSVGLPLITIAMITGSVVAREEWGSYWNWEHKQVAATVTWIFFGAALYFRLLHDWRGRKFALVIIAGFISILVTFFGVNLLAPGQHNFGGF